MFVATALAMPLRTVAFSCFSSAVVVAVSAGSEGTAWAAGVFLGLGPVLTEVSLGCAPRAGAVAAFLEAQPQVKAVHYPGLPSHPGHEIARKQQRGFGAMLSFELEGGLEEVGRFVNAVRIFTLAESLGGIESLVAHPATMTHASMDPQARHTAGITDTLLRLSVGLEGEGDLLEDLTQALKHAETGAEPLAR